MSAKKKELKREYKLNHRPMGVYQIRNVANDKILIGSTLNLPGLFNRDRLQLNTGSHPNASLQSEWKEFGSDSFAFEILDELSATEGPAHDYRPDLAFLEELWIEKLQPYGERGYNKQKKSREAALREIAHNRLSKV